MIARLFDAATPILPEHVSALIDFRIRDDERYDAMARMQASGVAALYNMLSTRGVAYLADEVGMGKTYQGLGVAAVVWSLKPSARILFISPRQSLQHKWVDEYQRFFSSNYRRDTGGDDRATTVVLGRPTREPRELGNLREWLISLGAAGSCAPFLRHTSFTRPVFRIDEDDLDRSWQRARDLYATHGLHHLPEDRPRSRHGPSWAFNKAFGKAANRLLRELAHGEPFYDLIIVDEAQCLRHPSTQTNRVLRAMFKGQARAWLFLSATPVHGSTHDVVNVLNVYPGREHLEPALAGQPMALQAALQRAMVRRQRRYRVSTDVEVAKAEYRSHERDSWATAGRRPLEVLAMGAVQKGLVNVMHGQNNRYRVGFLSSFESLQDSIGHEDEWYRDRAERSHEVEAPDAKFVGKLARSFRKRFNVALPHPKLDLVVDEIAPDAFGTDDKPGDCKHLVFARRVSTVHELAKRLEERHTAALERRLERYWGERIDWNQGEVDDVDDEGEDDAEDAAAEHARDTRSPFRVAAAKNGWLWRYRKTLQRSGRNALFLEENWLSRLCRAGGVAPEDAAGALSDRLWGESWSHAARISGGKASIDRPRRMRYLALHGVLREPGAFGLDAAAASQWAEVLRVVLHAHTERAQPAAPQRQSALFDETLWTAWDRSEVLPTLPAADDHPSAEALFRRNVVRSLLAQSLRLTDTLLDLYFADRRSRRDDVDLLSTFVGWAESTDIAAVAFRRRSARWIAHDRLIADSCLGGAGKSWAALARTESWPPLFNPAPVAAVTGGAGGARQAVRQFRLPSWPIVMVCTDTLKEGVDLHLFCDTVVHYGIAWTSGDMEQRVGRVDRYFSRIERRLRREGAPLRGAGGVTTGSPRLRVFYPHVRGSLEEGQIDRVIKRQKSAEALMDSPLGAVIDRDTRKIDLEAGPSAPVVRPGPFEQPTFPERGFSVMAVTASESAEQRAHYERWEAGLLGALGQVAGAPLEPVRDIEVHGRAHTLRWGFDATLRRYTLTIEPDPLSREAGHTGARVRRLIGKSWKLSTQLRVLVPAPGEADCTARVRDIFDGWRPDAASREDRVVRLGPRRQAVRIYRYDGLLRVVAPYLTAADVEAFGRESAERIAHELTADLALGYVDVHPRDGLFLGARIVHAAGDALVDRIVKAIARRADHYEELWTGEDAL